MPKFITVARRLIPPTHIAYVEALDPHANPGFHPERDFKGRVVLIGRDSCQSGRPGFVGGSMCFPRGGYSAEFAEGGT